MGLLRDLTGGYATPIFIGVAIQVASALAVLAAPRGGHAAVVLDRRMS
jgi:hypothetical protein